MALYLGRKLAVPKLEANINNNNAGPGVFININIIAKHNLSYSLASLQNCMWLMGRERGAYSGLNKQITTER